MEFSQIFMMQLHIKVFDFTTTNFKINYLKYNYISLLNIYKELQIRLKYLDFRNVFKNFTCSMN